MLNKQQLIILSFSFFFTLAFYFRPLSQEHSGINAPPTVQIQGEINDTEKPCLNEHPDWKNFQVIEGVEIVSSFMCDPDNPHTIAAAVKGTNNVSMETLMQSGLAQDAILLSNDLDKDGDPDVIKIKLEVAELNGSSPDGEYLMNTYDIAPALQPSLWVFAPKTSGMGVKNFNSRVANPLLRAPSPVIRVEQGDKVFITLENTHYLPHTIHLHGVDHPWKNSQGDDNDGMEEHAVLPGESHTYEIQPRHAGTMLYHCHVQTAQHFMMGLNGIFIVEKNQPNNWLQTINIGAGQVRHSSVSVKKEYQQEYDLHYQSIDKKLAIIPQTYNDVRIIEDNIGRKYNITESFENYFLLNGHSFPYTLRDSMIIANENEQIKLNVANLQRSAIGLHIHGHKATIMAYDGVDAPDGLKLTRDVFDIMPAQRLDLKLNTKNDGLNSYGSGLWMFHDHVPTGTTTDGIEAGGNMAIMAYKQYLDVQGMPKMHDHILTQSFSKSYYTKRQENKTIAMLEPNFFRTLIFSLSCGFSLSFLILFFLTLHHKK